DADAAGRDEMSELVHEYQDAEHEQKCHDCRHAFNSSAWAVCRAHSRDHLSTRRTTSSVVTFSTSCASSVSCMTRGMAVKPSLPSRKYSTATSLAAFNTHGRVPPVRSAR